MVLIMYKFSESLKQNLDLKIFFNGVNSMYCIINLTFNILKNIDGAASGAMPAAPAGPPLAFTLDPEVFYQTCTKIKRGRAHGPSGWRMEHYALVAKYCVVDDAVQASPLFKVFEAIANGRVPAEVRPFFAGGRLVGLTKPNGSVRPIVIRESLRRLVGKAAIQQK